jgi:hypothetical protein
MQLVYASKFHPDQDLLYVPCPLTLPRYVVVCIGSSSKPEMRVPDKRDQRTPSPEISQVRFVAHRRKLKITVVGTHAS